MTARTAYAFLDCRADLETVAHQAHALRSDAPLPQIRGLKLQVCDIRDERTQAIVELGSDDAFQHAWDEGLPYVIKTHSERPGAETAKDLSWLLNSLYTSNLYETDEPFRAFIVFEQDLGRYREYEPR